MLSEQLFKDIVRKGIRWSVANIMPMCYGNGRFALVRRLTKDRWLTKGRWSTKSLAGDCFQFLLFSCL
jgi:hypothetical protein